MSNVGHSFSVSVAIEAGVPGAIILGHILFLQQNTGANSADWTTNWVKRSVKSITKTYPYWTARQVQIIVERLQSDGFVSVKIHNDQAGDRSKSFLLTSKAIELFGEAAPHHLTKTLDTHLTKTLNDIQHIGQMPFNENVKSNKGSYTKKSYITSTINTQTRAQKIADALAGLETEKKEIPPNSAAPPQMSMEEIYEIKVKDWLNQIPLNYKNKEAFKRSRGVPLEKWDDYLDRFQSEAEAKPFDYYKRECDVSGHFLNWSRIEYQRETEQKSKTQYRNGKQPELTPREKLEQSIRNTIAELDFSTL